MADEAQKGGHRRQVGAHDGRHDLDGGPVGVIDAFRCGFEHVLAEVTELDDFH